MALTSDRLFLDTGYVIARFNRRDQYHSQAKQLASRISAAAELWTTDAVLLEIAAAFSHPTYRSVALSIWDEFHTGHPQFRVCEAAGVQLNRAVDLFRERSDKEWSLTDCLSFVVMQENRLVEALTADHHFSQAGFQSLLTEA